ncbi:mannitol dehydrogenase family protein [Mycobacterium xenopi]|uniref:Mannitol 2-dehydrogenase n=1 Tax=Mycobacterium xenopi TaxID=1789 RepID=A0AAD1LZZ7_MYCXE|nr:mannitol dehydrogenase family protein [Mycobacterium xenopi]MDA3640602.1 mannitol dehydrogenase family protein [Mycobacterium xenopi]MDA3657323.1 mannitol dehydrogenase family protein [Mycobacterium xenopi]ORX20784.1 mannitol dehydrogenase [Mycobacterium xenopi]SPX78668.1 mannitol-1-phosphate/altronate dehydrogenase [Mycobacterium xenopi]BBU21443.1 mannitol 2-dehydrogenase [Mycobacterium xenopi]
MAPSATKLNSAALANLPIAAPDYDRSSIRVGIAHLGTGHFHRAHQAMYIDRLLRQGLAREWGICGVGVLRADRRIRDVLRAQDGLYTLVLANPDGSRDARVIGSIVDYRYAPEDWEGAIDVLAAPSTRIVSMTITEGGYSPDGPAFALLTEGLARRRERGVTSPTIVSCDNIEDNGNLARRTVLEAAARRDRGLADWIATHTRFPNSMVDRITPATTAEIVSDVRCDFGVDDRWPVLAESFAAWVLEDDFGDGRPPLEQAGVLLVDDVSPYEAMKLRLLNAGHQCLCYFAWLCGYRFVHDAARDPLLAGFLLAYFDSEAAPTLKPVPGIDLGEYQRTLIERFANPGVRDTIARLCAYSSDRIPKWLLPVIRANLATGGPIRLASAAVAGWARYAEGIDECGHPIEVVDHLADALVPIARSQRTNPTAFIENTALFGDLAQQPRFVAAYRWALDSLHRNGVRATLKALL